MRDAKCARNHRLDRPTKRLLQRLLIGGSILCSSTTFVHVSPAIAQDTLSRIDIPSLPLGEALNRLGRQTDLQIGFGNVDVAGTIAPAVSGSMTPEAALQRLLSGSGLEARFVGARTVSIVANDTTSGVALGTIVVSGGGSFWDGAADTVYSTPASVAYISGEDLGNYQITTPGDILRGTTGVLSGENRNSGSLDVNIHGLQGQGRVAVTVDGAQNAAVVSQGYQGAADRTFVDPDFISAVAINKTADAIAGAIGGSVAVSTISVDDIVKPGNKIGFRLRTSMWGNTTPPEYLRQGAWTGNAYSGFSRRNSTSKPSLLNPTAGSTSVAVGLRGDWVDVVAGYSRRHSGNYFAGTDGRAAENIYLGPGNSSLYDNGGLSTYFHGEEVMNTSNKTTSGLLKATFHINEYLSWRLGYSHYDSTFGEVMASRQANGWVPGQQGALSRTKLNTVTSRLHYASPENSLVDVTWNIWKTKLDSASAANFQFLNESCLTTNHIWGTDVANTSRFATGWGDVALTFGGSLKSEKTAPVGYNVLALSRNGTRKESSLFVKADWQFSEEVRLNSSLRYTRYSSDDRSTSNLSRSYGIRDDSFGGSLGASWQASDWLMLYANYQNFSRLPSLFETVSMGASYYSPISPERAHNIDIGVNTFGSDLFLPGDTMSVKMGYFNKRVDNYIVRQIYYMPLRSLFTNIDKAKFNGFDLSGTYSHKGFTAAVSATYYTDVEFCRTADTCRNYSLSADYSTNHIPPKYHLALDLSQKFFDEKLTLGGRFSRIGPRAAKSEDAITGAAVIIAPIEWDPYTTVDLYTRYQVNEDVEIAFDIQNVTNTYYVDPLAQGQIPGPGRTARLSLDWRF